MTTEQTEEQEATTASTTSRSKKKAPKMIIQDDHVYGDTLHVVKFTSSEKPDEEFTVVATSANSAARLVGVNSASVQNVSMEDYDPS